MSRVLAATTSMGTKWESYSQALLAAKLPEWDRLVINGRRDWTPTGFIGPAIQRDAEFVLHIDEDCFVESRDAMHEILRCFDHDPGLVAAGIPDGGHYYRELNPAALNLFMVVFRMDALRAAWTQRHRWAETPFRRDFADEVARQLPQLDPSRVHWNATEPYYPLFWNMLSAGGRFLYLHSDLNRSRWSTVVRAPSGELAAEHLWYLRNWFSDSTLSGHDCPNISRYESFERELLGRAESGLRFRALCGAQTMRRFARRILA